MIKSVFTYILVFLLVFGSALFANNYLHAQCNLPLKPVLPNTKNVICIGEGYYNTFKTESGVSYNITATGGGVVETFIYTNPSPILACQITWAISGSFVVSITPNDSCGSGPTVQIPVTVNNISIPSAPQITMVGDGCLGTNVQLTVPELIDHTIEWNIQSTSTPQFSINNNMAVISVLNENTIQAYAFYKNNTCQGHANEQKIHPRTVPINPVIQGPDPACINVTSVYRLTDIRPYDNVIWSISGNGEIETQQPYLLEINWLSVSGNFQVNATVSNSCLSNGKSTFKQITTIDKAPQIDVALFGEKICVGIPQTLSVVELPPEQNKHSWPFTVKCTQVPENAPYPSIQIRPGYSGTGAEYDVRFLQSGEYKMSASINGEFCDSRSKLMTIKVYPFDNTQSDNITINGASQVCNGGSALFTASRAVNVSSYWYTLPTTNSINLINSIPTVNFNSSGRSIIAYGETLPGKCSSTTSIKTVWVKPSPTISYLNSPSQQCSNYDTRYEVNFNNQAKTPIQYNWNFPPEAVIVEKGGSPYQAYAIINWLTSGAKNVELSFTDPTSNNCKMPSALVVTTDVKDNTVSITPSGSINLCTGQSIPLVANVGNGLSYKWSRNGSLIAGAVSQSYLASQGGNYTVSIASPNGCFATSNYTSVTVSEFPTATISSASTTTFCAGGSVVLKANTGTGLTYQWKKDGTNISGATTTSLIATQLGSYTVAVTNSSACSKLSSAVAVTVNPLPTASITPASSTTFCSGGSVKLNANLGSGLTYQWKLNSANIAGATASSYTTSVAGSYSVAMTNASGCSATSSATVVTVNSLPGANITPAGSLSFCSGGSTVLNANTGTALNYQWKRDGTNISGATTASYSATQSGSYAVTVTNASACSTTSNPVIVTVKPLPTATITFATSTTFCSGSNVVLNANTGTGFTYQWMKDGNNISGATATSFTASQSGNYQVSVTSNGCVVTSTSVVVTQAAPLVVSIIGPSSRCAGSAVTLFAFVNGSSGEARTSSTNVLPQYSYLWSTGATGPSISVSTAATYTVTVTDNYSGCSKTESFRLFPPVSTSISATGTLCSGYVTLTSSSASSYRWSNGATTRAINAYNSGSYSVTTVSSTGCTTTSPSYTVAPCSDPCGPQLAGTSRSTVPFPCLQAAQQNLSVYPNRADQDFSIQLLKPVASDSQFMLYDQFGMMLKNGLLAKDSKETIIETKELPDGLYVIRVYTTEGLSTQKVIVRHGQ